MPKGSGEGSSATAVMTSPWKKTETNVISTSFQELMDSDLAEKLQKEEENKYAHELK